MSFIPQKKDALYVRGVVIACGMEDDQGDTAPNKEGIKKIFTNYLKQESDVQHSYISNFNVHQLENTITSTEIEIGGQTVPVGSWIASHMVLNPSIMAMIREGKLNGYSLGAIGDAGLNENITFESNFLNKSSLMYKDLKDYDELNPFFISFVSKASNGFKWEVMDYNQFLSKSSNGELINDGDIMTNNAQDEVKEEMVKVSVVERLLQPFLNKASNQQEEKAPIVEEEAKTEKEEEEKEAETVISNDDIMAKLEELPSAIATGVVDAMKELASQSVKSEEAEVLAKASEEQEEEEEEAEAEAEEQEEEAEDDKLEKGSKAEEGADDTKLVKSSSKLDEMAQPTKVEPRERFLGGKKRDEYGRVRKYL